MGMLNMGIYGNIWEYMGIYIVKRNIDSGNMNGSVHMAGGTPKSLDGLFQGKSQSKMGTGGTPMTQETLM